MDYMLYPIADHTAGRRSRHHAGQAVEAPRRADGRGTTPGRRSRRRAGQTVEAPRRAGGRGAAPGRRSRHHAGQTVEAPRRAGHPQGVALIGVNLSPCEGQAGHPQGVALLYTTAPQAARTPRIIVGPPLAGGLRRSIYDGSTGGANAAYYSRATRQGLTRGGFLGKARKAAERRQKKSKSS